MNALTLRELELQHATLNHKAEKLRQEQRATPATSPRALSLARQVRLIQERADDYKALLEQAKEGA